MTITLRIDNLDTLPDGGPLQYTSTGRGFTIGRSETLDWTLPDPSRFISGKHCDVRYEDGAYWLSDVSTNGTFLNGSRQRMKSPHRLVDGDRIGIGHYVVATVITDGAPVERSAFETFGTEDMPPSPRDDIWGSVGPAPAPIDRRDLMPAKQRGQRAADFSQEFLGFPAMRPPEKAPFPSSGPVPQVSLSSDPFASGPFAAEAQASPFDSPTGWGNGSSAAKASLPSAEAGQRPVMPREAVPNEPPVVPRSGESFFSDPLANAGPETSPRSSSPPPRIPRSPPGPGDESEFIRRFAIGAGIDPFVFSESDPGDTAEEIGRAMRIVVEDVQQLLKARQAAKVLAKSSKRTMLGRINNPLKFLPSPEEVIEVLFAGRRAGYLAALAAFEEAFGDLKRHEMATYAAMQAALARLLSDLSPDSIEEKVTGASFTSRKARNWEMYVTRWEAKTDPYENGMLDVFLAYFAEAYDEGQADR